MTKLGRPATCDCGTCKTCLHREYMRDYYERNRAKPKPQTCEFCGEVFTPPTLRPRKFCSDNCKQRALYWRENPRETRACQVCGADITHLKRGAKWCSDPCAQKGRRTNNPELHIRHRLKSDYGLTLEEYELILASQGGVCAICGTDKIRGFGKRLAIDHCHDTGKVRGILCGNCNRGVGHFANDPALLEAAAVYLRRN